MSLVLDSSAVLAWVHGDECTPEIEAVFDRVAGRVRLFPIRGIWRWRAA